MDHERPNLRISWNQMSPPKGDLTRASQPPYRWRADGRRRLQHTLEASTEMLREGVNKGSQGIMGWSGKVFANASRESRQGC